MSYEIPHLRALEAESIEILREVAAELERPVLLFSGGKDSVLLLRLAQKAFWPARFPFPVMHVDTGHNFPEVLDFRDRMTARLEGELVVARSRTSSTAGWPPTRTARAPRATGSSRSSCWTRSSGTASTRSSGARRGGRGG